MYVCHCFRTCLCGYHETNGRKLAATLVAQGADLTSEDANAAFYRLAGQLPAGNYRRAFLEGCAEVRRKQLADHKKRWGW